MKGPSRRCPRARLVRLLCRICEYVRGKHVFDTNADTMARISGKAAVDKAFQLPEDRIMTPNELLRAALPGIIVGCSLWAIGALVGPKMGPGWTDVIQGSSFFIGLIWAA